jgi:hypothetical protein
MKPPSAVDLARAELRAARLHWMLGLRFTVACGVPPIVGFMAGRPLAGVIASFGALLPMLADIGGSLRQRLTLMLATSLFMTAGLAVGAIAHVYDPVAAVCFLAGGVFSCLVVLAGHFIRESQDLEPLPTWSQGLRLLLSGQSIAGLRFALCYTAVAVAAVLVTQTLGLQRGFWVTITALLVMRPDGPQSVNLIVQRLIGTAGGIALAALVVLLGHDPWILFGWSLVFAFFAPVGLKRHYALGVGLITAMVMVLLDLALLQSGGDRPLLWTRLVDTALGCVLALCGTLTAAPEILKRGLGKRGAG